MNGIFIPTLRSARLTLRAFCADDHKHLLAMANDVEVVRHLYEGLSPSPGEVWQRMALALGQWCLRGYGMMAIEDRDGFVGRLGIYHPYDALEPQLSYILCQRGWGKGYATEGAGLIRDWMFATHRPRRLTSEIACENVASARVAVKLGAVQNGTTNRGGAAFDIWVYSAPCRWRRDRPRQQRRSGSSASPAGRQRSPPRSPG
jgi:[ribosomal protein S5]-alanine N-acetyltransferase